MLRTVWEPKMSCKLAARSVLSGIPLSLGRIYLWKCWMVPASCCYLVSSTAMSTFWAVEAREDIALVLRN